MAALSSPVKADLFLLPVQTLWWREMVRFFRQTNRVVGALGTPIVFWLLFGFGFKNSFSVPSGGERMDYLEYFYPGTLVIILLFASIFSTITIIEDRREGFLQGVMVAPVRLSALALGKVLGGTTVGLVQAIVFLLLAPTVGISLTFKSFLATTGVMFLVGFGLSGLGFLIAWRMDSTAGFHAIMNLLLMPMWLLSGASFPASGAHSVMAWIMAVNPLTYGMAAVRTTLYGGEHGAVQGLPSLGVSMLVIVVFAAVMFWSTCLIAGKREKGTPL